MLPADCPLSLYRGDSGHWRFIFSDAGGPSDLTGVTAKAQIRDRPGGAHITNMACTVTLPNIVDMMLAAVDAHLLVIQKGAWDLQLTYASGEVKTPVAGSIKVIGDVTDST